MAQAKDLANTIKVIRQTLDELAQPIAAVAGSVGLLQLQLAQQPEYVEALQAIGDQLENILKIIDGIWKVVDRAVNHAVGGGMNQRRQLVEPYQEKPHALKVIRTPYLEDENNELLKDLSDTVISIRRAIHELAQPLVVVTGTIDLLLLEMDQESRYFQELQTASEHLERIVTFIDDIRRIARQVGEALRDYRP